MPHYSTNIDLRLGSGTLGLRFRYKCPFTGEDMILGDIQLDQSVAKHMSEQIQMILSGDASLAMTTISGEAH